MSNILMKLYLTHFLQEQWFFSGIVFRHNNESLNIIAAPQNSHLLFHKAIYYFTNRQIKQSG